MPVIVKLNDIINALEASEDSHYPNSQISLRLMETIKGKGAFRRFDNLIHNLNIENKWYEFRNQAYEQIAIDWLDDHEIPFTRDDEIEVDGNM